VKDISVIISCRNEVVGTIITMRSALEEFKSGIDGEVVICDNSDDINYWAVLKNMVATEYKKDGVVKLIRQSHPCIFTAREKAISESKGEYLMIVDSHCIFGRNSIIRMIGSAKRHKGCGFIYGLMNFSKHHEIEAYCDRNADTFEGVKCSQYGYKLSDDYEIPFRGMPFLFNRKVFNAIDGYGSLSRHRLSWGGGDFVLGLKSAMMGYTNWMNPKAMVIHLGPFKDSKYFPISYIREEGSTYPPRYGMLITAYVIGGLPLLRKRVKQLSDRLPFEKLDNRDLEKVMELGGKEFRWLLENRKFSYKEIVERFNGKQIIERKLPKKQDKRKDILKK